MPGPGPGLYWNAPRPAPLPREISDADLEKIQERLQTTELRDRKTVRPLPMHELGHTKQRVKKLIKKFKKVLDDPQSAELELHDAIINLEIAQEMMRQLEQKTASEIAHKVVYRYLQVKARDLGR